MIGYYETEALRKMLSHSNIQYMSPVESIKKAFEPCRQVQERTEHSRYKSKHKTYDIYVTVVYLVECNPLSFKVMTTNKELVKIQIKVYHKNRLISGRTVDCEKNRIIPWIGGEEATWLAPNWN